MMKCLQLFGSDFDQWERDGLTAEEGDALVMALWHWYRGRPNNDGMTTAAKVLYSSTVSRLEANDKNSEYKIRAGRAGGLKTQAKFRSAKADAKADAKAVAKAVAKAGLLKPTSTSTTTSTATHSFSKSVLLDAPAKKVVVGFKPPTADDVVEYCSQCGYTFAARQFVAYYEARGWMLNGSPVSNWKALADSWNGHEREFQQKSIRPPSKLSPRPADASEYE